MKKIAILTSGDAQAALRVASLFNEGNRIRVVAVVADTPEVLDKMREIDPSILLLSLNDISEKQEELVKSLTEAGVEKVALENKDGLLMILPGIDSLPLPLFEITTEEQAPREVVAQFSEHAPAIPAKEHQAPSTPDEEWAATLKMNFDKEVARDVPPPIPGATVSNPGESPLSRQATQAMQQPNAPQTQQEPMPPSYLIWSVLATVFCCLVPGIVAIIFSSQVSSKYFAGDMEGARKASRNAEIWIIVSFVLGVLSATLYLPIALIN